MKVSDVALGDETGALMALQEYPIWHKEVESMDTLMLLAHYLLLKNGLGREKAIHLMRELKGECMLKLMLGDIEHADIIDFKPPIRDLVGPNLLPFMKALPFNARAAILIALAEERPLHDLVSLQWQEVSLLPWTEFSRKVLSRIPPRLGCCYVFWEENTLNQPTPLLSLPDLINQEMNVTWEEFQGEAENLLRFEHFAHSDIETLIGIPH